ncbi:MAG: hypothetical protein Q4P31_06000 [Andreesenia angusta]|nr:hypothetical protein [Andreesenia angusta]
MIKRKDPILVNDIARVDMNCKIINFYFFATKYCSHHDPFNYPIFDAYVERVLLELNRKDIDRYIWQLGKEYFPRKY